MTHGTLWYAIVVRVNDTVISHLPKCGRILPMVDPSIQLQILAVLIAALVGALIGQFLSFYRTKRQQLESLKNTLHLISQLHEQEISVKLDQDDSFLWYLRDELYQSYKENVLYLGEVQPIVLDVIRKFPSKGMENRSNNTSPRDLKRDAKKAYQRLDEIRPRQTFYLAVLGFLGFSQDKHGDRLEQLIEDLDSSASSPNTESEQEDAKELTGFLIPESQVLRIQVSGILGVALILAATLILLYFVNLDQTVEFALLVGSTIVVFVGFAAVSLMPMKGDEITIHGTED